MNLAGGNWTNLVLGGAAVSGVIAFWTQVKAFFWRICSFFVQKIEMDERTAFSVIDYLIKHYPRSKVYDQVYQTCWSYFRTGETDLVAYERFGTKSLVFWHNWVPFFYSTSRSKTGTQADASTSEGEKRYLLCLRHSIDVDGIIKKAILASNALTKTVNDENQSIHKRFFIRYIPENKKEGVASSGTATWYRESRYRLISHDAAQLGPRTPPAGSSLDNLVFPPHVIDLINEIRTWRTSKAWYESKGIPWKRGFLLWGPPGTGKTALARAFGEDLDMPIFVYNLSDIFNGEFIDAWKEMHTHAPCIALLEDLDNVFHGRENIAAGRMSPFAMMMSHHRRKKKGGDAPGEVTEKEDKDHDDLGGGCLNFDVLLNCLDGVQRSDGIFTIITTNDITKIDQALGVPRECADGRIEFISTRPGRIDKAVKLDYMTQACKHLMAARILKEYPAIHQEIIAFIDAHPDFLETPAQFQERCSQLALAEFWRISNVLTDTLFQQAQKTDTGEATPNRIATSEIIQKE